MSERPDDVAANNVLIIAVIFIVVFAALTLFLPKNKEPEKQPVQPKSVEPKSVDPEPVEPKSVEPEEPEEPAPRPDNEARPEPKEKPNDEEALKLLQQPLPENPPKENGEVN